MVDNRRQRHFPRRFLLQDHLGAAPGSVRGDVVVNEQTFSLDFTYKVDGVPKKAQTQPAPTMNRSKP